MIKKKQQWSKIFKEKNYEKTDYTINKILKSRSLFIQFLFLHKELFYFCDEYCKWLLRVKMRATPLHTHIFADESVVSTLLMCALKLLFVEQLMRDLS